MRDLKAHDFIHAVRSYLSELECEYPDLSLTELQTVLKDATERAGEAVSLGASPAQATTMTLLEQRNESLIPPWA